MLLLLPSHILDGQRDRVFEIRIHAKPERDLSGVSRDDMPVTPRSNSQPECDLDSWRPRDELAWMTASCLEYLLLR
jgi:hypothetical protein